MRCKRRDIGTTSQAISTYWIVHKVCALLVFVITRQLFSLFLSLNPPPTPTPLPPNTHSSGSSPLSPSCSPSPRFSFSLLIYRCPYAYVYLSVCFSRFAFVFLCQSVCQFALQSLNSLYILCVRPFICSQLLLLGCLCERPSFCTRNTFFNVHVRSYTHWEFPCCETVSCEYDVSIAHFACWKWALNTHDVFSPYFNWLL